MNAITTIIIIIIIIINTHTPSKHIFCPRSLLELSENASDIRDTSTVTQLVDVIFREANIQDDAAMTFEDFRRVFASKEYESTLQAATLSSSGMCLWGGVGVEGRKSRERDREGGGARERERGGGEKG